MCTDSLKTPRSMTKKKKVINSHVMDLSLTSILLLISNNMANGECEWGVKVSQLLVLG